MISDPVLGGLSSLTHAMQVRKALTSYQRTLVAIIENLAVGGT